MGFELKKIPVFDYLPKSLLSLRDMTNEKQKAVKDIFKEMFFWVMTVKNAPDKKTAEEDIPFSVNADRSDEYLCLTLSGRLDTLTAPELLSVYQTEKSKGDIKSITIDSGSLTYISSARLRVFLIMRKALEDGSKFQIRNMRNAVKEIIENTGFSDLFNCEGPNLFPSVPPSSGSIF